MPFSEIEEMRYKKALTAFIEKHRPPAYIRKDLDLAFRIDKQSVEIFQIRPLWSDSSKIIEEKVAKATFVKSKKIWKIYWQRADLKWHGYEPLPDAKTLEEFLKVVGNDEYACFFG